MKKAIILLISLFIVSVIGCSTSESTLENGGSVVVNDTPNNVVVNQPDNFRNLVDFLYRISGVNVVGPASNPTITIRGIS